jgi:predicted RNase H-like HicB family nuclease
MFHSQRDHPRSLSPVNHRELSDYAEAALRQAHYEELEDGTFAGHIPGCAGVVALARTLPECERESRSTLDDWISVGLTLRHPLPLIG